MTQVAFITGASRGIGKGVARGLLEQGYECVLIAREPERLGATATELRQLFPERAILALDLDISNPEAVDVAVQTTLERFGRIDVVFNNAGIYIAGSLELSHENFEAVMRVNYFGAANVARATLPVMAQQDRGYLVNLSSVCGKVGFAGVGAYSASKFALLGLNDSLFRQYAGTGVKVTAICPSWVNTDMSAHAPIAKEDMIQPADIAQSVLYLLSLSKHTGVKELVVECLLTPL
jgi:NAD(P)-dependent dehydrogenase (short-subunit alcohol dehydrogenase family)